MRRDRDPPRILMRRRRTKGPRFFNLHPSAAAMFDVYWIALTLVLFGIGFAYIAGCDRI